MVYRGHLQEDVNDEEESVLRGLESGAVMDVDAAAAAVLPSPAHVEIFHIEAQGTVAASARCLESALHAPEVLPRWSLHYRLGSNQDIGAGKAEL